MKHVFKTIFKTAIVFIVAALFFRINLFCVELSEIVDLSKERCNKYHGEVKDITIFRKTEMKTPTGKALSDTLIKRKGGMFRIETVMNFPEKEGSSPLETIVIYNGKASWMITSFTGKKRIAPSQSKKYMGDNNWWDGISEDAFNAVSNDKIVNTDCFLITPGNEKKFLYTKIWVSKKDFYPLKIEMKQFGKTTYLFMKDYKSISPSYKIPYTTILEDDKGGRISCTEIKSVKVNSGIDNSVFDPAKVKDNKLESKDIFELLK